MQNYQQYEEPWPRGREIKTLILRSNQMSFLRKVNEVTQVEEPISISTAELAAKTAPKPAAKPGPNGELAGPFLQPEFVQDYRQRWDGIQAGFVDEPRASVRQADDLVASAIKRLAESFGEARTNLEGQTRGDVNTEDLRLAIKKYRTFFQKLMAV
jgi:hypothetical protein